MSELRNMSHFFLAKTKAVKTSVQSVRASKHLCLFFIFLNQRFGSCMFCSSSYQPNVSPAYDSELSVFIDEVVVDTCTAF